MKKKILLITPYNPYYNTIASKRIYNFILHLSANYNITCLTTNNGNFTRKKDISFEEGTIKYIDYRFEKKKIKKKSFIKKTFLKNLIYSILEYHLFIFSGGYKTKKEKWFKKINQLFKTKDTFDYVICSYGPFFTLKLASYIKNNFNSKVILDFRDCPFSNAIYPSYLPKTLYVKKIIKKVDFVVTVNQTMKEQFEKYNKNIYVLYNGFNFNELCGIHNENSNNKMINITYTGSLTKNKRDVKLFFKAISKSTYLKNNIVFNYAGSNSDLIEIRANQYNIRNNIKNYGLLSYSQAIDLQNKSDILFLIVNDNIKSKGNITGKFFEYYSTGKPIIVIGPKDWELKYLIDNDPLSKFLIKKHIYLLENYIKDLKISINRDRDLSKFDYSNQFKNFTKFLERVEY